MAAMRGAKASRAKHGKKMCGTSKVLGARRVVSRGRALNARAFVSRNGKGRLLKQVVLSGGGVAIGNAVATLPSSGGAGGGGMIGGGSGGGGGGGGNFGGWGVDPFFAQPVQAKAKRYEQLMFVQDVLMKDLPVGSGCPSEDDMVDSLKCKVGNYVDRTDLDNDANTLMQYGIFENVRCSVVRQGTAPDGASARVIVQFIFTIIRWPPLDSVTWSGTGWYFPYAKIAKRIMDRCGGNPIDVAALSIFKEETEKWYHEQGYVYATVLSFDGMDKGKIVGTIAEGVVQNVSVEVQDPNGEIVYPMLPREFIKNIVPFQTGVLYNIEDGKKALRDLFAFGVFDNVQVLPSSGNSENQVNVEIVCTQKPIKTSEAELEWSLAPNDNGKTSVVSLIPGGNIYFEHRNVDESGMCISGSLNTGNLLLPQDDLGWKFDLLRPNILSRRDKYRTKLTMSAFNTRKLSSVFNSYIPNEEVPPVWIDRNGIKLFLEQIYRRASKGHFGFVFQEVAARDDAGAMCPIGVRSEQMKQDPNPDGPPTTTGEFGRDRQLFFQYNMRRDATYQENGATVGARDLFNVDQSLFGLGFNRHQLSFTRFMKLFDSLNKHKGWAPTTLVANVKYEGTLGLCPSYECAVLGGPNSVRGYNVGELACCRRTLEWGVELRLPIPFTKGYQACGYWEHGTDLGSAVEMKGNPTRYFRKPGAGTSWGGGVKVGSMRVEYSRDCNAGKGTVFVRFGERH